MKTYSLRARLALLLALAVLVVFGAAARVVDLRSDAEMRQRFDASLQARAQAFAALASENENSVKIDAFADRAAMFPGGASIDWYALSCNGQVLAQSIPAPPMVENGISPRFVDARLADGRKLRVVALHFASDAQRTRAAHCEVRYALDRGPLDELLRELDWILLGSLLAACVLVMLLTPWLVRRGMRPLAVLARSMAGVGPDAPDERLPSSGTTELVPLVTRFNEVLARMDAALARERQFASGLAHEFRTRLAELRTLVDVEMRYPSGRDVRILLGEVGNIGAELEATVTALLQLTRIQSGLEQLRPGKVRLAPLVARVRARHQNLAHERNVSIDAGTSLVATFEVEADPALMEVVLDNLLGNAVAYAPADSIVTLRNDQNGILVYNVAPGLEPVDLANFGKRFWRKGEHSPHHVGLGLALAGAAARALRMTLNFELKDGVLHATLCWNV